MPVSPICCISVLLLAVLYSQSKCVVEPSLLPHQNCCKRFLRYGQIQVEWFSGPGLPEYRGCCKDVFEVIERFLTRRVPFKCYPLSHQVEEGQGLRCRRSEEAGQRGLASTLL
ncbi:uncharacterized protein DS421_3g68650 [Arachis hypogaea]|nr:uncharacterized protein DS421_3g68650 [Arachis hypogaea]